MRARKLQLFGIVRDDRAQALTEFAVVIPVVLLFFFAMLQYFEIVRASQLGNYAAYVAARVYAVRASVDGDEKAKELATKAAAMALAPIARFVPGEVGGLNVSLSQFLPAELPNVLKNAARLGEGYVVAYYVRLNSKIGGGSVVITTSGTPKQVDVTINYPQPIYMPGLAEMWNLVAGDKIYYSMKTLREGLSGIPGTVLPVYELLDDPAQTLRDKLAQFESGAVPLPDQIKNQLVAQFDKGVSSLPVLPRIILPYLNIRSKCSMGYEDWGSKDPEYRPRKPSKGDEKDTSRDPADDKLESDAKKANDDAEAEKKKSKEDNNEFSKALQADKTACDGVGTARTALQDAKGKQQAVDQNTALKTSKPDDWKVAKDAADEAVAEKERALASAQAAYQKAHSQAVGLAQSIDNKVPEAGLNNKNRPKSPTVPNCAK